MIYSHSLYYENYNDSLLCLSREDIKLKKNAEAQGGVKDKEERNGSVFHSVSEFPFDQKEI